MPANPVCTTGETENLSFYVPKQNDVKKRRTWRNCSLPRANDCIHLSYVFVVFILPSQLWRSLRAPLPSFDETHNNNSMQQQQQHRESCNEMPPKTSDSFSFLQFYFHRSFGGFLRRQKWQLRITCKNWKCSLVSKAQIQSQNTPNLADKNPDCLNIIVFACFFYFNITFLRLVLFLPSDSTSKWLCCESVHAFKLTAEDTN